MNNTNNGAKTFAQIEQDQKLARIEQTIDLINRANAKGYNWSSLVKGLSYINDPKTVAEGLLFIYFEFTHLMTVKDIDYGADQNKLNEALYYLRSTYNALQDMLNKDETLVQFTLIPQAANK